MVPPHEIPAWQHVRSGLHNQFSGAVTVLAALGVLIVAGLMLGSTGAKGSQAGPGLAVAGVGGLVMLVGGIMMLVGAFRCTSVPEHTGAAKWARIVAWGSLVGIAPAMLASGAEEIPELRGIAVIMELLQAACMGLVWFAFGPFVEKLTAAMNRPEARGPSFMVRFVGIGGAVVAGLGSVLLGSSPGRMQVDEMRAAEAVILIVAGLAQLTASIGAMVCVYRCRGAVDELLAGNPAGPAAPAYFVQQGPTPPWGGPKG